MYFGGLKSPSDRFERTQSAMFYNLNQKIKLN